MNPADVDIDIKLLEQYYRRKPAALDNVVLAFLKDSRHPRMIVHGAKAINAILPSWLDKETKDWDIFAKDNAEGLAKSLEQKLDDRYGGDFFAVEPAQHLGTFRVRSKVTGDIVADITLQDKVVSFRRIGGVNYVTLQYQKDKASSMLADPTSGFRHKKDRDTLQRIAVHGRSKRRKLKDKKAADSLTPSIFDIRV